MNPVKPSQRKNKRPGPNGQPVALLTERQKQLLDFIIRFYEAKGYMPSVRQLTVELNIKTLTGVICHLRLIMNKGYLAWPKQLNAAGRLVAEDRGLQILYDTKGRRYGPFLPVLTLEEACA